MASTTAPAAATTTGSRPNVGATTRPARITPSSSSDTLGIRTSARSVGSATSSRVGTARSVRKNHRKATYSTAMQSNQGAVIRPAKPMKVRPEAWNANRFVRFDTGSSSDALFDRCAVA